MFNEFYGSTGLDKVHIHKACKSTVPTLGLSLWAIPSMCGPAQTEAHFSAQRRQDPLLTRPGNCNGVEL